MAYIMASNSFAVDHLLKIEDLKEKIAECANEAFIEEAENKSLKKKEAENGRKISTIGEALKVQKGEILKLENALLVAMEQNPNEDSTANRDSEEIDLTTMIARAHFILMDVEQAKRDGGMINIEPQILKIRKMFNDCFGHLKHLNKSNQVVSHCLRALKELDVSPSCLH